MTIREEIDFNYKQRENLLKEYYDIQKACKHENTKVGLYGDIRHNAKSNICIECDRFISLVDNIYDINTGKLTVSR